MPTNELNTRIAYFVGVLVGGVGAVGQAFMLHNTLVHSYPFKMMDVPPFSIYAWIGEVGFYIAPTVAVIAVIFSRSARQFLIPAIPVIICPLVFWFIFEMTFASGPYDRAAMMERNFDGYTGETVRYYFGFEVAGLILWGTIIGAAVGFGISAVSNFIAKGESKLT